MGTSNAIKVLNEAIELATAKQQIEERLELLRNSNDKYVDAITIKNSEMFYGNRRVVVVGDNYKWFDGTRFYSKIKYLLIAELEESLEEATKKLDSLVIVSTTEPEPPVPQEPEVTRPPKKRAKRGDF